MTPEPAEHRKVNTLGELLARLPAGHSLIPSSIYSYFVLDQDGRNKGYLTADGEVQWWAGGLNECRQ